jgi:hypothetical protein
MKVSKITAAAITAVLAVALAACSTGTDQTAEPTRPVATETAPATDIQTDAPVEDKPAGPQAGAELVSDTDVDAAKDAGLGIYTTSTGTKVAIDKTAALPETVVADIRASVGTSGAGADKAAAEARDGAMVKAITETKAAGKTVVFIIQGGQYGQAGNLERTFYAIATTDRSIVAGGTEFGSAAEALATAQAGVAAQADPSAYAVIDHPA